MVLAFLMQWLLICVGSSPLSSVVYTSSKVGLPAVLPCTVASQLDSAHTPHIQWQTITSSVFERMGEELFQGEAYRDRADVPEEMLMRGNCSLFLWDVRFSDAGIYECYLVVGESSFKNRIFIQSVQLAVVDHKTIKSVETGADLILDLYTHQAEQVIFQNRNDSSWTVLWERGADIGKKGYPKESNNKLFFKRVTASSAGTYKVLDSQGLALSTVKVKVKEPVLAKETESLRIHSALGKATMSMPPLNFITLFLLFHLMLQMN
ncbi:galectin 17 isoform X2 [Ctenopharyngodon idella]|uniref:galectin 17 isoform X2 n=1 Tax=Ctenopharyngodon idella TaxID=7959 RepID=UPI00222FFD1E|nr:galectin 17 isoform X2 [Ctenopharyngodon idella]